MKSKSKIPELKNSDVSNVGVYNEYYHFSECDFEDEVIQNIDEEFNIYDEIRDDSEAEVLDEKRKRNPKRKIKLSESAQAFKSNYFRIFNEKKFPKTIVRKIHDSFLVYFKFPKMNREEVRCSDLYFQNYEQYQNQILTFLYHHQRQIEFLFLQQYKRSKEIKNRKNI